MRLDDKAVTMLLTEDEILDFINYGIREDNIRKSILEILSADPSRETVLCIKIPYHEEPYCMILKWKMKIRNSGLLLVLSKDWKIIVSLMKEMINQSDSYEREFLYPVIENAESQFKTLEKL